MIVLDAKSGVRGRLIDLDAGRDILYVRRAVLPDDPSQLGEYEAFRVGPDGDIAKENGKPLTYTGRCRMRFEPAAIANKTPVEPVTHRPVRQKFEKITVPVLGLNCQHYACNRTAAWTVSDEVPTAPVQSGSKWFGTAKLIGRRFYCDWHYRPPRIIDTKGEVMEELHEIKARPD